ncbi:MAG: hypothetical protein H7145_21335, partial [Akkermansiaceae bacterium]|nr:hypothetical protein [Armatimonadota bacterium]
MKTIRSLVSFATIASLALFPNSAVAQTQDTALVRLGKIKEGDWRTARPIAEEFAGVASGNEFETLRVEWSRIGTKVARTEIVNAFLRTIHPDGLKVALLGLEDPDAEVRKTAAQGVIRALGLPGGLPPEQVKAQITARKNQTLEQAR